MTIIERARARTRFSTGRTVAEIDAFCQAQSDVNASSFCLGVPDPDLNFAACFERERNRQKLECVTAELETEGTVLGDIEDVVRDFGLGEIFEDINLFTSSVQRGQVPPREVLERTNSLPVATIPIAEVSAEVNRAPAYQYPWNVKSGNTASLQRQINVRLLEQGYCPVIADGILGPLTCGAARAVGISVPSTCSGFTEPTRCGGGGLLRADSLTSRLTPRRIAYAAGSAGILFILWRMFR